jgi:hypothetical protein
MVDEWWGAALMVPASALRLCVLSCDEYTTVQRLLQEPARFDQKKPLV